MKAMLLRHLGVVTEESAPLELADLPRPAPGDGEVLVEVSACGVCHTELDEIEGRTPPPELPIVLGHQAVGRVIEVGKDVRGFRPGDRVGAAWIYSACGRCRFCLRGEENLCPDFRATGRDTHGGYAEFLTVPAAFAFRIPATLSDAEAAPLLCAGAIGYRSLRLCQLVDGQRLGLTGFGASAHLVLRLAAHQYPASEVYVFARNPDERGFALELGATWAGDTTDEPPVLLDAIIDTTPVWKPVVEALRCLAPGGRLVINAIRKEDVDKSYLQRLDYSVHLWQEKEIKSVANVCRRDVSEFLKIASEIPINPEIESYPLHEANRALVDLKFKKIRGGKVLRVR